MIILDRGFDLISAVQHDYFYESNVYDFKDVGEGGHCKLDSHKVTYLNDDDDLWERMKYKHIAEVHQTINEEVASNSLN